MEGYWTARMKAASVDGCEPNDLASPFVAEWWNTLSSIPISLAALLGRLMLFASDRRREPRFVLGYLAVFIVGVGSVALHGTLWKLGQALDELPVIGAGLVFAYAVRFRRSAHPPTDPAGRAMMRWMWVLGLYAIASEGVYFLLPDYFAPFLLSYSGLIGYLVVRTAQVSFREEPRADRGRWCFPVRNGRSRQISPLGANLTRWHPEYAAPRLQLELRSAQVMTLVAATTPASRCPFSRSSWASSSRVVFSAKSQRVRPSVVDRDHPSTRAFCGHGFLRYSEGDTAPLSRRGLAFGAFNLVSGLSILVARVMAGVLWDLFGPGGRFSAGAALSLISLCGFALVGRRRPFSSHSS